MSESNIKLPDTSKLVVSSSPHYHDTLNIPKIMYTVLLALVPAVVASVYFFGWRALMVVLLCMVSCVAFEALFNRFMGNEQTIQDGSALVTGALLALSLPVTIEIWMCIVGSLIAIGLGKMVYGGLGGNPFNPALVGRVALLLGCPQAMTTWVRPNGCALGRWVADAVTGPTPLAVMRLGATTEEFSEAGELALPSMMDAFIGNVGGSLGETSALALLIGGAILLAKKLIRWQVPAGYLGTVLVFTLIGYLSNPWPKFDPCMHLLSGGLLMGAFFMATDMVTTPVTGRGSLIFGIGCGLITVIIRLFGNYPEGMTFAILIMNALTPLIDRFTAGRPFGAEKKQH